MRTDLLIGTVIYGFRVERQLGEGGMGKVYAAKHESLPTYKVIKVLLPEFSNDEQIRARFMREAQAVAALDHPNIITVDNFGRLPSGELFLMMPLLNGKPLDEYLQQSAGKIAAHHTLQIAAQVASALQHAHASGIIHRDLKPQNVYVERRTSTGKETVKLLDFGIAKDAKSQLAAGKTRTGMSIGTPHYMACEQYDDAGTVTPAADIFALAIVIIEMLTADLPWGVHDEKILYFRQKTEAPEFGPEIPRAWIPVLSAALSPDPRRRPQAARSLIIELASTLDARPPIWQSGSEIVREVAPDLIKNAAPQDATVRRSGQLPQDAFTIRASTPGPIPQEALTIRATPTAKAPTTLGAANGVTSQQPSTGKPKIWALALIGMMTAAIIGAGVAFVAGRAKTIHDPKPVIQDPVQITTASDAAASVPVAAAPDAREFTPFEVPIDAGRVATAPAHRSRQDASVPNPPDAGVTVDAAVHVKAVHLQMGKGDLLSTTKSCGDAASASLERLASSAPHVDIDGSAITLSMGAKKWTADRTSVTDSYAVGFFEQNNNTTISVTFQSDMVPPMIEIDRLEQADGRMTCVDKWRGQARRL